MEPAGIVAAELLPTEELLIEPRGAGLARVFLFARHLVRVVEVAVDLPLPLPPATPVPAACGSDAKARIATADCYALWRARLEHGLASKAPALAFEDEGLFAQARAAQAELARVGLGAMKLVLSPFGVRLAGAKDEAERRLALRAIWPAILGPLRLDG